ncbi:hypothetical protein LIER_29731 [Lithospermum erythrorhizon]|uniref:Uncharacterized protein n=1 Tax=Lithospermum erythrorhizon TaxID=34254 RepID=A0AAV3RLC1_LITER
MADQMAPSMWNASQVRQEQNQNTTVTPTTEPCVHVDTPSTSQQRPVVPPIIPLTGLSPMEDIREEGQATSVEQEHRARESYHTDDPPNTPTYSPVYTSSMLPEYGDTRIASYRP